MKSVERPPQVQDDAGRRPYEKPALRVFGSVTAITAQLNREKGAKDGGPNNFKT